jgi:hypothetical protein
MKGFILTFEKGGKATAIIQREFVQDIQRERTKLKTDPKYRGGKLQIRTIEGFKAKKLLNN